MKAWSIWKSFSPNILYKGFDFFPSNPGPRETQSTKYNTFHVVDESCKFVPLRYKYIWENLSLCRQAVLVSISNDFRDSQMEHYL